MDESESWQPWQSAGGQRPAPREAVLRETFTVLATGVSSFVRAAGAQLGDSSEPL